MKLGLFVSLLLLITCSAFGQAKPSTGDFVAMCGATADTASSANQTPNSYCLGYIKGYMDGVFMDEVLSYRELKQRVCIPGIVTPSEVLGVVVKYIRQHPEKSNQPIGVTTWEAVHRTYQCRK